MAFTHEALDGMRFCANEQGRACLDAMADTVHRTYGAALHYDPASCTLHPAPCTLNHES